MLWHQAGFVSACSNVDQADVSRSYGRKTERGSKNLATTFTVQAVERENIHLYPPAKSLQSSLEGLKIKD
jgi:hypothetical protein